MARDRKFLRLSLIVTLTVVGYVRYRWEASTDVGFRAPASLRRAPSAELAPQVLSDPNHFAHFTEPTRQPASPVGKYWSGCLFGGQELQIEGLGYRRMRLSRNRGYGHPTLLAFLKRFARRARREKLGDILVGDISQPRGGPAPSGHRSHQTGLDVDIWFRTLDPAFPPLENIERETWGAPSMVGPDGISIHPKNWTPIQAQLLHTAADFENVERIFVNPVIKRELCRTHKGEAWMTKVRPYWGHDSHFHVRLACPSDAADCLSQGEPDNADDGCGPDLDGWFISSGRIKAAPPSDKEAPVLVPAKCLSSESDSASLSGPSPALAR